MGKTMKTAMRFAIVPLALVLVMSGQIMADSYFRQATHVGAFEMMGQKSPEKNDTATVWVTDGKSCSQTGDGQTVIFDADKGKIFMVDHNKKEYSEVPINLFGEAAEEGAEAEMSEAQQMMKAMMGSIEVNVSPTDQTEKIGDWDTKLYNVELGIAMMPSKQQIWATEDIKIDYSAFDAVSNGMMAMLPGFEKIVEEMKQVKGMPVKTIITTTAMGGEIVTTTNLIEYAEKDAPAGIYEVPEGYKKTEVGMNMGMGKH